MNRLPLTVAVAFAAVVAQLPHVGNAQDVGNARGQRLSFARPVGSVLSGTRPLSPPPASAPGWQYGTQRSQALLKTPAESRHPQSVLEPTPSNQANSILVSTDGQEDRRGGLSPLDFAELALPSLPGSDKAGAAAGQQVQELPQPDGSPRKSQNLPTSGAERQSPAFDPLNALPPGLLPRGVLPRESLGGGNPNSNAAQTQSPVNKPQGEDSKAMASFKYDGNVSFGGPYGGKSTPHYDAIGREVPFNGSAFLPQPIITNPLDPHAEGAIYRGKRDVPVQRPIIELGRPLYTGGLYKPAKTWFGDYNLVMPHFMVYGDFRTAVAVNRNANSNNDVWAARLNLDMDLEITATERLHAFMGPLDRGGDFTRLDFSNSTEFVNRTDMRLDTLFFEGDLGSILGGFSGTNSQFDLPFTFGFLPLFYQNGIWANDNVIGAAAALPARHSRLLDWSNFDATVFWASDQINTDAFAGDNNAAELFGTAWFIEAYDGYIEADYAFVHDDVGGNRSYHNLSIAFTRRYFHRISNAIRFISNFGQSLPSDQRTADGHLLLFENSLISKQPNTLVPYFNCFYGQGRTQSLARAGGAGGVLNNVGINFETDGLTGYPTLDPTGVNTVGAAAGINMLGSNFDHQLILEFAALSANGGRQFRNAAGDQYAVGMRYQKPLSHAWIFRTDHMAGLLQNSRDIFGSRMEFRWKF